jgi:hypothetical protein
MHHLGGGTTIGPLLIGMERPVQIVPMDASVSQIVDVACIAAYQAVPALDADGGPTMDEVRQAITEIVAMTAAVDSPAGSSGG